MLKALAAASLSAVAGAEASQQQPVFRSARRAGHASMSRWSIADGEPFKDLGRGPLRDHRRRRAATCRVGRSSCRNARAGGARQIRSHHFTTNEGGQSRLILLIAVDQSPHPARRRPARPCARPRQLHRRARPRRPGGGRAAHSRGRRQFTTDTPMR